MDRLLNSLMVHRSDHRLLFQTDSSLAVMTDSFSGAPKSENVSQMEHGAEMKHFVKVTEE